MTETRSPNVFDALLRDDALRGPGLLVGRLLMAAVFVLYGVNKAVNTGEIQGYMEAHGVPGGLVYLVILVQVGAGLLVALGYYTRLGAVLLAGFCIIATSLFHADFGNRAELAHFMKDLAIAGGFLFMMASGPGPLSIDAYQARRDAAASNPSHASRATLHE